MCPTLKASLSCLAGVMIMHNASSYHALPALVSALHQTMGAPASNGTAPALTVKSHPLPLTSEESVQLDSLLMVLSSPLLSRSDGQCQFCSPG